MKISIRNINGHYKEVIIEADNAKIDLGLFDFEEQKELVEHLEEVISDLKENNIHFF